MAKNRLDFQAQLSRHSHDVSAGYSASLSTGMIVPQYFDILGPGDSIYYRTHMFARLQDVVTAFLGEIDLHVDYFFVPLQMLYTPFGQIFAQTDDFISSVYSSMPAKDKFPLLNFAQFEVDNFDFGNSDYKFECEGKSMARLLDSLDANPLHVFNNAFTIPTHEQKPTDLDESVTEMPAVVPWAFAAYQCIYQKYYRNDEFEKLMVSSYNFDSHYAETAFLDNEYFRLRYVQRPSDYFTKTRVSPISSAVNKLGQSDWMPDNGADLGVQSIVKVEEFLSSKTGIHGFVTGGDLGNSIAVNAFTSTSANVANLGNVNTSNGSVYLSAANIRALFAVDKFARIYGRADKTYDDQILAHFGIKIPHDVKHDLTHLKHYHVVLQSDPIFGTANTVNADGDAFVGTIGQVGGQGQCTLDSDQEKFTAPVHGVFMAVAYAVTKPRYTYTFNKLHFASERLSFPIPEFDKLGAQPLYAYETNPYYLQQDNAQSQQQFISVRIGWQNRYQQFKEKYDRASLVYSAPDFGHNPDGANNIYSSWIIARNAFGGLGNSYGTASKMVSAYAFFESPYALNNIMVRPYNGNWSEDWYTSPHLMFQSDPILTEYKCFAKKVSWMSETGEPDL